MKKAGAKKHMTLNLLAEAMQAGFSQVNERIDNLAGMTARQFVTLQNDMDDRFYQLRQEMNERFSSTHRDILSLHDLHADHERRITTLETHTD